MKIQCDVCEKAQATVICCADEAALCAKCDVEVHAANKLASKHQRLHLQNLASNNQLPTCDICREKPAFIFCVEDRALFCRDCDEPIHSANALAANHQRFLATGIRVALSSDCNKESPKPQQMEPKPPAPRQKTPTHHAPAVSSPLWAVDDLLQFPDYESSNKKEQQQLDFSEFEWLTESNLFDDQVVSHEALVPELPVRFQPSNVPSYKPHKMYGANKKPRIHQFSDDDEELFRVPDLG